MCNPCGTRYGKSRHPAPGHGISTAPADVPLLSHEHLRPLPAGVPADHGGPRWVALVALLMGCFRQSKWRVALFLDAVLGQPCSPGCVATLQQQANDGLLLQPYDGVSCSRNVLESNRSRGGSLAQHTAGVHRMDNTFLVNAEPVPRANPENENKSDGKGIRSRDGSGRTRRCAMRLVTDALLHNRRRRLHIAHSHKDGISHALTCCGTRLGAADSPLAWPPVSASGAAHVLGYLRSSVASA
jgi:hypothetical protein